MSAMTHTVSYQDMLTAEVELRLCRLRPNQCIVVKKALCYKAAANSRDTYKFVSMQFHANPI